MSREWLVTMKLIWYLRKKYLFSSLSLFSLFSIKELLKRNFKIVPKLFYEAIPFDNGILKMCYKIKDTGLFIMNHLVKIVVLTLINLFTLYKYLSLVISTLIHSADIKN